MNPKPIGVFDSGLGGLTAVKELRQILPGEDIVYFGDTARVPYGSRERDTIIGYARQDIAFLLSKNVKAVLAACGTVSSTYPEEEGKALPVDYLGVVQPTAEAAAAATRNGIVGIIGTETTVASGSYQSTLARLDSGLRCTACACPLFVPLVENGHFGEKDALATLAAQEYLGAVKQSGADTLILGCTHYPLLAGIISDYFDGAVTLVDSGRQAALALKKTLEEAGLLNGRATGGKESYYVSADPIHFGKLAAIFLGGKSPGAVQRIAIEAYALDG